jgi:hypothetical protein
MKNPSTTTTTATTRNEGSNEMTNSIRPKKKINGEVVIGIFHRKRHSMIDNFPN